MHNEGIYVTGGTINAGTIAAGHTVNVSAGTKPSEYATPVVPGESAHRTIVCVDVKSFGDLTRTNTHQVAVREGLYHALQRAFGLSGIRWDSCYHEDRGDGAMILVPAEIPKRDVAAVPANLVGELVTHNELYNTRVQIRLRMAIHAGEVRHDEHGVAGTALNHAFRLLEAAPLKQALDQATGPLALIVSAWYFTEVIEHDPSTRSNSYTPTEVAVKETTTTAWIRSAFD